MITKTLKLPCWLIVAVIGLALILLLVLVRSVAIALKGLRLLGLA